MIKTDFINKYKNFLIPVFLIVSIIFSGWNFLLPKIIDIFQMRKTINEEKRKLIKLTEKEAFLESLDEYELIEKTQLLLKILPSEKDIILPWATLKSLASQFNLKTESIQVDLGDDKLNTGLSTVVFSLRVNANNKENIREFIEKIKVTRPLMEIEDLSIYFKTESESEANLKIKIFFLGLPKEIGKVEDPLSLLTTEEERVYQKVSEFSSPLEEEFTPSPTLGKENPFAL
jgi:hypothetical protein